MYAWQNLADRTSNALKKVSISNYIQITDYKISGYADVTVRKKQQFTSTTSSLTLTA